MSANTSHDNYLIRVAIYLLAYLLLAGFVLAFIGAGLAVLLGPLFLAGTFGWPLWVAGPLCLLAAILLVALAVVALPDPL